MRITQEELAAATGLTRSHVQRSLADFAALRVIENRYNKIQAVDQRRLDALPTG